MVTILTKSVRHCIFMLVVRRSTSPLDFSVMFDFQMASYRSPPNSLAEIHMRQLLANRGMPRP